MIKYESLEAYQAVRISGTVKNCLDIRMGYVLIADTHGIIVTDTDGVSKILVPWTNIAHCRIVEAAEAVKKPVKVSG